jgi:hypothetical protein
VSNLAAFARSLDQELVALLRGASLECLACGEFVMHARGGSVFCPECCSQLGDQGALEDTADIGPAQIGAARSGAETG